MRSVLLLAMTLLSCAGIQRLAVPLERAVQCTGQVTTDTIQCAAVQVQAGKCRYAITAAHCTPEGREYVWLEGIPSKVLAVDRVQDVALIQPVGDMTCELRTEHPVQGEPILLYGNPLGLTDVATIGYVARESVFLDQQKCWVADVTAYMGNSGGGAWDSSGRCIGIVSKMPKGGVPSFVFMVPVASVLRLVGELCK